MVRSIFDGDVWASFVKGDTGEVVRPSSGDLDDGWLTATYPNRKYDNWAKLILFEACQWIEEKGVFDWDSNITYSTGALVNYSGITYISILASNLNQQPDTATTYWKNYYDWLIAQAGQTMIVANEAALGTGVVDGQIRGTEGHNFYTWDDGTSKWIARSGNIYSSVPSFGNVTFPQGTLANYLGGTWRFDGTNWSEVASVITGTLNRPTFTANASSTQIDLLGPGGYHLSNNKGWVHWTGTIAYNFTTLAASTWSYLYLDESTISGPGIITSSNFTDSTTAPTYNSTKGGWYNGNDRCIFAVYGTGASSYTFFKNNGDLIQYEQRITDLASTPVTTGGTDYSLTAPPFCIQILVTFLGIYNTATAFLYWRETGSSGNGHLFARISTSLVSDTNSVIVHANSSQSINIYASATGCNAAINTDGFYLPKGM